MSNKARGIRAENERMRHYRREFHDEEHTDVQHAKGSLGRFDIIISRPRPIAFSDFWELTEWKIDVKTGSKAYVKHHRKAFQRWASNRPTVRREYLRFDWKLTGSGVWTSESYPADFERDDQ